MEEKQLVGVSDIRKSFYVNQLINKSEEFKAFVNFLYKLDNTINLCNLNTKKCTRLKALKTEAKNLIVNEVGIFIISTQSQWKFNIIGKVSEKLENIFCDYYGKCGEEIFLTDEEFTSFSLAA